MRKIAANTKFTRKGNNKSQHKPKEFDVSVLTQLAEDENSCVELQELSHHLALHPYHLNDVSGSIKNLLNQGIARYNARFDGILFGYKDIRFCSELGAIVDDFCFIHVDVTAGFFIFKPVVGKILQGVVNKQSTDHVACLVHNIFNVSLPNLEHADDWLGYSCNLNSEVSFKIISTNFDKRLPYIKGELISILSNSTVKETDPEESAAVETTKVKSKKAKVGLEENSEETTTKVKSKKKKHVLEASTEENSEEITPRKSSGKKRKREATSDESLVENGDSIVREEKKRKKKMRKEIVSDELME